MTRLLLTAVVALLAIDGACDLLCLLDSAAGVCRW